MAEVLAILALLLAAMAFHRARGLARRFDGMTQSYWELKYDYTRLRSQLSRLDPERPEEPVAAPAQNDQQGSFVPLSSMRKKEK